MSNGESSGIASEDSATRSTTPPIAVQEVHVHDKFEIHTSTGICTRLVFATEDGSLYTSLASLRAKRLPRIGAICTLDKATVKHAVMISERANLIDCPRDMVRAPASLDPKEIYVQRPRMAHYDPSNPSFFAKALLDEAYICQFLMKYPHPNIATYHGVEVNSDSHVTGLVFQSYRHRFTLAGEDFDEKKYPRNQLPKAWFHRIEEHVKAAISHLHGLGFCHNSIAPSNIALSCEPGQQACFKIYGFEACRRLHARLEGLPRPVMWHNPKIRISLYMNDYDGINQIVQWLNAPIPMVSQSDKDGESGLQGAILLEGRAVNPLHEALQRDSL